MRALRPLHIAIFFFIIAAALLALIATHKTRATPVDTLRPVAAEEDNFSKYIEEAEQQNAIERDRKEQTEKLAKLAKAKKDSVECQFWTQQKQNHATNKRVEEKITQFCELPQTQDAASTTSTSQDAAQ